MAKELLTPDYIFESSWEVCNKVGGIYTVLSTRAKTLHDVYKDKLFFIGPDFWVGKENPLFIESDNLCVAWKEHALKNDGLKIRVGRWNIPGEPIVFLVDFFPFFAEKDAIYGKMWEDFRVDSLHAYGDYDEASMFSYAAGKVVEVIVNRFIPQTHHVIYQAHEWMSGLGMMFLKKNAPRVATIFTTHATSIGRSIAGNNKLLYEYFSGYNGDQMADELNMQAKHSVEKQSALRADCFTTVSTFTDLECKQLLDKPADVVLPNGFEAAFVPKGVAFTNKRRSARKLILQVVSQLTGQPMSDQTLIVSTSGRNDFRCKGFDVYLESLAQLNARLKETANGETKVVALIEVPCWLKSPRADLMERLSWGVAQDTALDTPMITHDLHHQEDDRILNLIKHLGLWNTPADPVKVVLIPCYLEGNDGIFNMPYYDLLTANDLCVYPSYYEPWGYTPLESMAFHVPTITTSLSGYGVWCEEQGCTTIDKGVAVIYRNDSNTADVINHIVNTIEYYLTLSPQKTAAIRKSAVRLALQAEWKNFFTYYRDAYSIALKKVFARL